MSRLIAALTCHLIGHARLELATVILSPDTPRIALALICPRCGTH